MLRLLNPRYPWKRMTFLAVHRRSIVAIYPTGPGMAHLTRRCVGKKPGPEMIKKETPAKKNFYDDDNLSRA